MTILTNILSGVSGNVLSGVIAGDNGFDPNSISGLVRDWEMTANYVSHVANAVTDIEDKIIGDTLSQATPANRPIWNGTDEIAFDGNDYLVNSSPFMWDNGEITIIHVVDNATTEGCLLNEASSSDNDPVYLLDGLNGANSGFIRNDANNILLGHLQSIAYNDGNKHVLTAIDTGANLSNYVDGALSVSSNYTRSGTLTLNQLAFGALVRSFPGNFYTGGLKRILVYNRAISEEERQYLENGLSNA